MTNRLTLQGTGLRAALCLALALGAAPGAGAADLPTLTLRVPLEQTVEVHGSLNYDKAGGAPGTMAYPIVQGAGAASLLVGLATHAILSGGMQAAEKKRMREEADKFLLPHRATLDTFTVATLANESLPLMTASSSRRVAPAEAHTSGPDIVIDSAPVFYLTQDTRALILENVVKVRLTTLSEPVEKTVRVVLPARPLEGASEHWFGDNAVKLRQASAQMFARSVDLAMNDVRAGATTPGAYKTVRYPEGGTERMERAQILSSTCEHLVLRTLRGNLMVVPRQAEEDVPDTACTPAVAQQN